jgi:hypothetical protein
MRCLSRDRSYLDFDEITTVIVVSACAFSSKDVAALAIPILYHIIRGISMIYVQPLPQVGIDIVQTSYSILQITSQQL